MPRRGTETPHPDLKTYHAKRDFAKTTEPLGQGRTRHSGHGGDYVIQKHAARRLHYDFRLEMDGVLKSWAVTKGPSLDPGDKRLAVRTEDHPLDYGHFEGSIPKGEYGGGTVMLWDRGAWSPRSDPREGLKRGVLKFDLRGERLQGGFALIKMKNRDDQKNKRENWLLVKEKDALAERDARPVDAWTTSVATARSMEEIAQARAKKHPSDSAPSKRDAALELAFVAPQLATLETSAPEGDRWLHEIKYDGYRVIAVAHGDRVKLFTRSEKDWTGKFPGVAEAVRQLKLSDAVLDGEVVVLDAQGHSRFSLLQQAIKDGGHLFTLFVFDLLRLKGKDLRKLPQLERKQRLQKLLKSPPPTIHYSDHQIGHGPQVLAEACRIGLEGIVSKRTDAPYRSARTRNWIKSKCGGRDEFVIGGFRPSSARGRPFASLLLGEYKDGKLHYRGRVGTGFNQRNMDDLAGLFARRKRKASPFSEVPASIANNVQWLKPDLVAEIQYTERTHGNHLRHPVYLGLRRDKPSKQVEDPMHSAASVVADDATAGPVEKGGDSLSVEGVRLTHPDKILFPQQGITKRALAEYFVSVQESILAHAARRPLTLVRCPRGRTQKCFYQKHHGAGLPPGLIPVDVSEKQHKRATYVYIEDLAGLLGAVQVGVLELHLWGSTIDALEQPDRLVFDLDPDESLDFSIVRGAASQLRKVLQAAELESFPLLTGGKGIHLVVPLTPYHDWPAVKSFARGIATAMAQQFPQQFVATASKAKRKGKIFIDWLRNDRGATAISPYATRAKENCPVATPVSWRELSRVRAANQYTLGNIGRRLGSLKQDPWEGYFSLDQTIHPGALEMFRE